MRCAVLLSYKYFIIRTRKEKNNETQLYRYNNIIVMIVLLCTLQPYSYRSLAFYIAIWQIRNVSGCSDAGHSDGGRTDRRQTDRQTRAVVQKESQDRRSRRSPAHSADAAAAVDYRSPDGLTRARARKYNILRAHITVLIYIATNPHWHTDTRVILNVRI